jgi:hypothetical protein
VDLESGTMFANMRHHFIFVSLALLMPLRADDDAPATTPFPYT